MGTNDSFENEIPEPRAAIPGLVAGLRHDPRRASLRIERLRLEPLDAREAVRELASSLRVSEMGDESLHVVLAQAQRAKTRRGLFSVHP